MKLADPKGKTREKVVMDTGWRKCIGCLQLLVSFRKRAANDRVLLQKMTNNERQSILWVFAFMVSRS